MTSLKEIIEEEIFVEDLKIDRDVDDLRDLESVSISIEKLPFEINGIKYHVFFESKKTPIGTVLSVSFRNITAIERIRNSGLTHNSLTDMSSDLNAAKHGITGTGNAFGVFRKIYNVVGKYIEKNKPTYFKYDAKESNRKKLYNRLMVHVQKELPIKFTKVNLDTETGILVDAPDTFVFKISYN